MSNAAQSPFVTLELVEKHLQVSECGKYRDTKTLTKALPIVLRAL